MEHKISNELPPLPSEGTEANTAPSPEAGVPEFVAERQATQALEAGRAIPADPSQQLSQAIPTQQAIPPQLQQTDQSTVDPQAPIIADDSDLIEKEWVLKAKEIVARTRHDPYEQNKEVERIKADYMKKRYNKDIRVTKD